MRLPRRSRDGVCPAMGPVAAPQRPGSMMANVLATHCTGPAVVLLGDGRPLPRGKQPQRGGGGGGSEAQRQNLKSASNVGPEERLSSEGRVGGWAGEGIARPPPASPTPSPTPSPLPSPGGFLSNGLTGGRSCHPSAFNGAPPPPPAPPMPLGRRLLQPPMTCLCDPLIAPRWGWGGLGGAGGGGGGGRHTPP